MPAGIVSTVWRKQKRTHTECTVNVNGVFIGVSIQSQIYFICAEQRIEFGARELSVIDLLQLIWNLSE